MSNKELLEKAVFKGSTIVVDRIIFEQTIHSMETLLESQQDMLHLLKTLYLDEIGEDKNEQQK